jgi:hypothetical protein
MSETDTKELLMQQIADQIAEVSSKKEEMQIKSLSRHAPEKVAEILYLFSTGSSQTKIVKKYGFARETVISVLTDYADALGSFKELSGKLSAKNYMNLSSLEEDLIEKVRERMDEDPEMAVSFRDLKELSIAKANANREAITARGEVTNITEGRKVYTKEDYDQIVQSAKDRIKKAKIINAEIVTQKDNE